MQNASSRKLLQPTLLPPDGKAYVKQYIPSSEPVLNSQVPTIKVCEPDLGTEELELVVSCIKDGWISSMGKYTAKFEDQFSQYCGTKYAVSVTNGTHALQLAVAALGIGPGDEVIVPTFTMIATANAARYCGASPVFVDARPDTWNIDEAKIEQAITEKTKAIIIVHTYGHPAEMDAINAIAKKHNLWVIEDAAESHGAEYKGVKTGALGDVGCFSFYANKMVTTGEGGVVVTNNEELHHLLYKLHNHAFADDIHFWHEYLGYNFRMTNIQAAIGFAQMNRIDSMITKRREHAQLYMKLLGNIPGIRFPVELADCKNTYWMFGLVLEKDFPLTRDELRHFLAKYGIETRTFFIPMHMQPIYFKPEYINRFPVADSLCKQGLYLPSAAKLTSEQITFISSKVQEAAAEYGKTREEHVPHFQTSI